MVYYTSCLATTVFVVIAAGFDIRSARIPNALTYSATIFGLGISFWNAGIPELTYGLIGLAVAFFPALFLFTVNGIGGGDVKLLAAVGALVGYPVILDVLFYSIVTGSGMALAMIIWKGRFIEALQGIGWLVRSLVYPGVEGEVPMRDLRLPFAVAVMLGTLWALYVPALRVSPELSRLLG